MSVGRQAQNPFKNTKLKLNMNPPTSFWSYFPTYLWASSCSSPPADESKSEIVKDITNRALDLTQRLEDINARIADIKGGTTSPERVRNDVIKIDTDILKSIDDIKAISADLRELYGDFVGETV